MNNLFRSLCLGLLILCGAPAHSEILHTEKSLYRNIEVYSDDELRCLRFGRYTGTRQSCINLSNPDNLEFNYTRMMMGALYLNPNPQHALIIGLGGGTLPTALRKLYPALQIDVAEIDSAVVRVARQYFGFTTSQLTDSNRVILIRRNGLPDMAEVRRNATALEARLKPLGVQNEWLLSKFSNVKDWPANTRVLTDQYSPANLLNSK